MKFLGSNHVGCQCSYCIGNGKSKAVRKSIKHGARQESKREFTKKMTFCDELKETE